MKEKKGFLVILCFMILIAFALIISTHPPDKKEEEVVDAEDIIETVEPEVYVKAKESMEIIVPNSDLSEVEKKTINIKGLQEKAVIRTTVEEYFKGSYFKDKKANIEGLLIDTRIWNETLELDFTEEILKFKINDNAKERKVIASLVNSLIPISDKYIDVVFLINGERRLAIFGVYDTQSPFAYFDESF